MTLRFPPPPLSLPPYSADQGDYFKLLSGSSAIEKVTWSFLLNRILVLCNRAIRGGSGFSKGRSSSSK